MKNISKMSNQEIIDVVKAHSEGKPIEYCADLPGGRWIEMLSPPVWDFHACAYRVKKENIWANIYLTDRGEVWGYTYPSKVEADTAATNNRVTCVEIAL